MICEEIFDESSQPSIEEIRDYATKIGIDPDSEPQLLPLAAEGLMKALPPGWKPCYDEKSKSYYYLNKTTGKTQWEHPLDEVYRGVVLKKRAESQSLSLGEPTEDATYNRDELPSFEEPPPNLPSLPNKKLDPILLGARKKEVKLSPLKAKTPLDESTVNSEGENIPKLSKQKSEDRISSTMGLKKIGLSMFNSFDEKKDVNFDKDSRSTNKTDFTIIGGGSKFLKSNTKKQDADKSVEEKKVASTPDFPLQPRSILRERAGVIETSKSMEFDNTFGEKVDKDEDDRKSVRFNLKNKPNIMLDVSDRSGSDDEFKQIDDIIKINLSSNKSKLSLSPIKNPSKTDVNLTNNGLKLIKPNPSDYINPTFQMKNNIELSEIFQVAESDDESAIKSEDEKDNSLNKMKKQMLNLQEHEKETDDKKRLNKLTLNKEKQEEILEQADQQFEAFRTSIWEQKSKELDEFKEKVHESHKKEMERILIVEKTKHEQNIKQELENLRREMENRCEGTIKEETNRLEDELENAKEELEEKYTVEEEKYENIILEKIETRRKELDAELGKKISEMEGQYKERFEATKQEIMANNNVVIEQLKENHSVLMENLKREFKVEEQYLRKEHEMKMYELKNKNDKEMENEGVKESTDENYEKIRCEKRLLEDKYRCLKEKYLKLKSDVKLSIEKRNKRREQSATTTGSETELSHSIKKERSPGHSPIIHRKHGEKPPTPKHPSSRNDINNSKLKPEHKATRQIIIQDFDTSASDRSFGDDKFSREKFADYDSSDGNINPGRSRKKLFSRIKSSSTSRINNGNKSRKTQRSCSPVENLRKQLQKLEDLEDQFPDNPQADTYHLRYPFTDGQKYEGGSSELEFFRHRIHLERDSIRRAKESLRSQKCMFQQRQKELKLKHGTMARHTLQQLCQEERDLTDMEVSLHRTRSLLGEKIIRLRHLEQSLQRATLTSEQMKQEDATLSDISSHSASSGISSTEFATADNIGKTFIRGEHLQESSEIIQSLENLNSEIREIWEVLHKQHQAGNVQTVIPPLPLVYPDLGWPILAGTASVPAPPSIPTLADRLHNYRQHVALANAQSTVVTHATQGATTTLVERTRNLRHWLRQAGIDPSNDNNPQTTL